MEEICPFIQSTVLKVLLKSSFRKYCKEFSKFDSFITLFSLSIRVLPRVLLFQDKVLNFIFLPWMVEWNSFLFKVEKGINFLEHARQYSSNKLYVCLLILFNLQQALDVFTRKLRGHCHFNYDFWVRI